MRIWSCVATTVVGLTLGCHGGGADGGSDATDSGATTSETTGIAESGTETSAGEVMHVDEQPGCDPLVPSVCAYPFPSMMQLETDATTSTGYRVALAPEVMPGNIADLGALRGWLAEADGFPRATRLLALFPERALDPSNLPSPTTLAASLEPSSPVQVFDLDSGERIPVWAELEQRGSSPSEQALIVRPMRGLPFGTRVGIVITDALRHDDDSVPASSPAFIALRDQIPTDAASVESRRDAFEAMFELVEQRGVARSSIVLAWQVVIASREATQRPLPALVAAASAAVANQPPSYVIESCKSDAPADMLEFGCELPAGLDPRSWRRVFGTVELPNYLDDNGRIVLDASGVPEQFGSFSAEFVVNIPQSLASAGPGEALLVNFGHGALAEPADYLDDDANVNGQMVLADKLGAIFVGTRWVGISNADVATAVGLVDDFGGAPAYHDLLVQGIVNQVMMIPFARDVLAQDPLLWSADASGPLIDPNQVAYTGISQGGIFGTTLMAVSPHVRTGVLHVPSSAYNHIFSHSPIFSLFQSLVDGVVPDLHEQQVLFVLIQRAFDAGDPINYAEQLVREPMTALGAKHVLLQCAVGDTMAPWFGCDMLARTAGLAQVTPAVRDVFGLDELSTPSPPSSSALHYYDPQLGTPPLRTDLSEDVGAHYALRRNDEIHQQIVDFFDPAGPGTIVNHCAGACVIVPVPEGG